MSFTLSRCYLLNVVTTNLTKGTILTLFNKNENYVEMKKNWGTALNNSDKNGTKKGIKPEIYQPFSMSY